MLHIVIHHLPCPCIINRPSVECCPTSPLATIQGGSLHQPGCTTTALFPRWQVGIPLPLWGSAIAMLPTVVHLHLCSYTPHCQMDSRNCKHLCWFECHGKGCRRKWCGPVLGLWGRGCNSRDVMVLHCCSKQWLSHWLWGGTRSGEQGVWCWARIVDHGSWGAVGDGQRGRRCWEGSSVEEAAHV
jgi:hypothetical protein